ncbi:MAG: hypothetical protein M1830_007160 [Pleopsidium flavum]|nr:MAG: hypothetical protein M1830_007160 [Pleopsidium flavum]
MEKDYELGGMPALAPGVRVPPPPTSVPRSVQDSEFAGNDISFREIDPVDIQIRNLSVEVDVSPTGLTGLAGSMRTRKRGSNDAKWKTILDDVSADLPKGSLTAILGGSGSGKTSFLNVTSHRMSGSRLKTSGTILYNGGPELSSIRSAYVMQQDVLLPTLTVRETLQYAADLRLPPPTTEQERRRVVEEVILELGLKDCAGTRIGSNVHKGCSGGEKRRTSLGVQLLANPSVLFLDEVTTGLDSSSAHQLVRTMKTLATKGRTILTTIHQPRSEIWGLFDHIVLLSRGSPIYSGPADECLPYFESLGYDLPPFCNPAEYLIDLAAVDTRSPELEETSLDRVEGLKRSWRIRSAQLVTEDMEEKHAALNCPSATKPKKNYQSPVGRQIRVLTARTFKVTYRDPMGMAGSLFEAISMAIITGWIYLALDGSLAGIRSREGALYTAAALQGYLILLFETYRLTVDIELFDRERTENIVGVPAFLISRRLARVFVEDIPVPLLFSVIFYFMAGFRPLASQFFTFFAITLLSQYIAITFATTCVAISRDFAGATLIANMGYTLQSLGCGYFVQSNEIPVYVRWLKWTAYVFYAFGALCANEFVGHTSSPEGQFYDCPFPGGATNLACKEYTGAYVMKSLGFPANWIVRPIITLLAFAIAFYLGAALVLQYWKVEMCIAKARKSDTDYSAGKEMITTRSLVEARTIGITLDKYTLNIIKRNAIGRKAANLSILQPVSASLEPGLLNVIMGPSGSGKTSLLNLMAHRLHSSLSTKYETSGRMLYNGAVPTESVIRSICCYVCQDDDALLPSLTVRETLRFAAGLRLPSWMSTEEKHRRADSVLLKMGLRDCADNLVGSELLKGISGGEKRRVTIAIQILTDPKILLLDEPTSGLDAFTAASIIEVLRGLAEESRTVVLTIHQPRSDLFKHFGNVLLLARGGSPVYAGNGNCMLKYFEGLGFACPQNVNPADFALDLITIDLQHEAKETESREKVQGLAESWNREQPALVRSTSKIATPAELGSMKREMAPLHIALPILLHRGIINFQRQPQLITARIMQVVGLAIILTLFFAPLKNNYYSVQSRLGYIQEFAAMYFVGMLQNVAVYPNEKEVFYREHDDGAYSVEAFFLQYTSLEVPFEIVTSLIFAVLTVLAAGLPRTVQMFFVAAFNCFCIVSCGESVGIMFNTLFRHTGFAVNVTSVVLSVATLMGGVMSLNIPSFLGAFNHLSPIVWSLGNLAPYSLRDQQFTCNDYQRLANGECPISTGLQVLQLYNLDKNAGLNLLALGICTVIYRIVAYLLLRAKRTHWNLRERFRTTKDT